MLWQPGKKTDSLTLEVDDRPLNSISMKRTVPALYGFISIKRKNINVIG